MGPWYERQKHAEHQNYFFNDVRDTRVQAVDPSVRCSMRNPLEARAPVRVPHTHPTTDVLAASAADILTSFKTERALAKVYPPAL